LDGGTLPLSANRIGDVEVDFRAVEGSVLLVERVCDRGAIERGFELRFRMIPGGHLSHELVRPRRELRREWKTEITVHLLHQPNQPLDLVTDLILRDKAVSIVLGELTHAS